MTEWTRDMADVAAICGNNVAQELSDKLPGAFLYVPKKRRGKGPISRLNDDTAEVLVRNFGGDRIYIPTKRRAWRDTFNAIENLVKKGLSTQEIAMQLGITQGYVFQVRRKAHASKIRRNPKKLPLDLNAPSAAGA